MYTPPILSAAAMFKPSIASFLERVKGPAREEEGQCLHPALLSATLLDQFQLR